MNIAENIINTEKSYKAKDIKRWCEKHRQDIENDFVYDADRLYCEYWNDLFETEYEIDSEKYYFAKRKTSRYLINYWELIEDVNKSR